MALGLRITRVALAVAVNRLEAMQRFYLDDLGFRGEATARHLQVNAGDAELRFNAHTGPDEPFYHFAVLLPGNRFEAARHWLAERSTLLPYPDSDDTVFEFDDWDARACYFHDPASNIVELIAHHGIAESPAATGAFTASKLQGISEVGLVTADPTAAAKRLVSADLELWDGELTGPRALGFIGRQAHTLIVCPLGRPWLPTGRPAETHPLEVTINDGDRDLIAQLHNRHSEVDVLVT